MRGNLFYIVHPAGQLKELNRSASLGKLEEKLETLRNAIEKLDPDECTAAVNRLSRGIDRVLGVIQRAYPEEPKARPFTITEFNDRFKLGSPVHFAEKDGGHERRVHGYLRDVIRVRGIERPYIVRPRGKSGRSATAFAWVREAEL